MTRKTVMTLAAAFAVAAPLALSLAPRVAFAQSDARYQPSGVLSLAAQASAEIPQDVVTITLFYEQEASDPSSLTSTLNQRADAALQRAKGVSGVTARSGQFSIFPSTDRDGRISAWRGRTEVVLESRDFAAASKLAGDLSSAMQVGNVQFSLSPEAQRAAEQKLTGEAIASFRDQAAAGARAFGYSGYSIREVNIGHSGAAPRPMMMMSARAMSADAKMAQPLSLEGGTSTVMVNVSGSVQMK
ncbi:SIMPL domain-containing protein [Paraburkholderia caballeronis]|uniref:Predicted secreted protein n=1 Tax=Paraburkholderia caballeronis TaxID=416943 RepID=A0A1H7R7R3_9BURK|nr:SIMPL domain-containing protein [Paraburkholderia caballeronis]PXW23605.1 putative secreted protein [Paraburkholderia caballeronis]PXW98946.1 putative secreted protein [Paraburkholderia caballeronis]RAJ96152.1 putative secreted protein [Paraburkholderia caballeronis]SEC79198.1 Predicted secreted protein [Paraburkholderia caballeronis]SEL56326.1 Predicted secreted protein [Paraburkholderia caballeronis]